MAATASTIPHVWHLRNTAHRHPLTNRPMEEEEVQLYKGLRADTNNNNNLRESFQKNTSCFDFGGNNNNNNNPKHKKSKMTVPIDGIDVEFAIQQAVTPQQQQQQSDDVGKKDPKKPDDKQFHFTVSNSETSPLLVKCRLCLMKFDLVSITLLYLALYLLLNVIFSALWTIENGKCCGDPTQTFAQIFDFSIQTSTTIGYGGYVPEGKFSNFLVFMISFLTLVLNSVYAGFLFLQFVTPYSKITFSNIMTISNLNGFPCLQIRVCHPDFKTNPLTDVEARLSFEYHIRYKDDDGTETGFGQTCSLRLLSDRRHELNESVWTLRHIVDESSPLFGLRFDEAPGTHVKTFHLFVRGVQEISGQGILKYNGYQLKDLMVGYRFQDQFLYDKDTDTWNCDYSKMNDIVPSPVWYPTPGSETHSLHAPFFIP